MMVKYKSSFKKYAPGQWNPFTSKWKAALEKDFDLSLGGSENILYLGASSGTTVSFLSDVTSGIIFAVEKAPVMAIPLVRLAQKKSNIAPLVCDARNTSYIRDHLFTTTINILFQDIPSPDQVDILSTASHLVDTGCRIFLSLKTQSISLQDKEKTLAKVRAQLQKKFIIEKVQSLEPFHKKHYFFILKKKPE